MTPQGPVRRVAGLSVESLAGKHRLLFSALWSGPLVAVFLHLEVLKIRGRVFT